MASLSLGVNAGMSGDWWGTRSKLQNQGVEIELGYSSDFISNIKGGVSLSGDFIDTRTVGLTVDMDTMLGWSNTQMYMNYMYTNGGDAAAIVGSPGISNLEAGKRGGLIYEFWFDSIIRERHSIRIGLYDTNTEFDVTPAAGLFINGAFGMGTDIAQSGASGPSIFPVTSLALRYRNTNAATNRYFQVALLDGDPGSGSPRFSWTATDGVLLMMEGGMEDALEGPMQGKIAYGGWVYSRALTQDAAANPISPSYNFGLYLLLNGALMYEGNDPKQGLAGFMRVGLANQMVNVYGAFASAGLVYTGLLPGMDQDQLGLAMFVNLTSKHYYTVTGTVDPYEMVMEFSYRNQFGDDFYVQPFMQWVYNPDITPATANATVFGLRMAMDL